MRFWIGRAAAALLAGAFGLAPLAAAALTFADGGVHSVVTEVADGVLVDDGPGPAPTQVTLGPPGFSVFPMAGAPLAAEVRGSSILRMQTLDVIIEGDLGATDQALVELESGLVDDDILLNFSATLRMSGGVIGDQILALGSSQVELSGGFTFGDIEMQGGSHLEMTGGELRDDLDVLFLASAVISGGVIGDGLRVREQASVTIRGRDFTLDGVPVTSVSPLACDPAIADDCPVLGGVLEHGTPLNVVLVFEPTATLVLEVVDINEAPTVALTPVVTNLDEDADTSSPITVATVTIDDDALGTNNLSLSGDDVGLFELMSGNLRLKAGTVLDFEANPSLDVTVEVDDPVLAPAPNDSAAYAVTINDVIEPPVVEVDPRCSASQLLAAGKFCKAHFGCLAKHATRPDRDPTGAKLDACQGKAAAKLESAFAKALARAEKQELACGIPETGSTLAGTLGVAIDAIDAQILLGVDTLDRNDNKLRASLGKAAGVYCGALLAAEGKHTKKPDARKRTTARSKALAKFGKGSDRALARATKKGVLYTGAQPDDVTSQVRTLADGVGD